MSWTEYVAQIPGANGLYIKLELRNDAPNITSNSTVIHYRASVFNTSTAKWHNLLNETPMRLALNGVDILNVQNGNFDVRTQGASQTIREGNVTVAHNSDGTKQVAFLWHFDARNTWHSINGPAVIQGQYTLPNIPRTSKPTLSKSEFYFGETVTIHMNRVNSSFVHDVTYEINGATRMIANNVATDTTLIVPFSDVPTNADKLPIVVRVTTKSGSNVLGTEALTATVSLHPDVKPTLTGILVQDTIQAVMNVFNSGTDFIRGVSKIRATAMGTSGKYGSQIKEYLYRVKGKTDVNVRSASNTEVLAPFQFPQQGIETIRIQIAVVDSRGRQSDWIDSRELRIHFYTAPRLGTMLPTRTGGGTTITIKRNWAVSSLTQSGATTEKNTASLKFYTRQAGSNSWIENMGARSTALSGMDAPANLSGTFAGNQTYEIKAVLSDRFSTVESAPIAVGTEALPLTFYKDKVAVGGIVDKNGAPLQVRGDTNVIGGQYLSNGKAIQNHQLTQSDGRLIQATGDWNNYTETGLYWGVNMANSPHGTHGYRYVEVFKYDNETKWVLQKLIDFNGEVTAQRVREYGVWKDWNYVLTTKTLPPVLASMAGNTVTLSNTADANDIENHLIWLWGGARNKPATGLLMSYKINNNKVIQIFYGDDNIEYQRIRNDYRVWTAWRAKG